MTNVVLDAAFIGFLVVFTGFVISQRRSRAADSRPPDGEPDSQPTDQSSAEHHRWTALDDAQLARHVRESSS